MSRVHWSGRLAFILATAGSAIGLGNIWKFPYVAGENGGGAFVLIYLLCILLVGIPIMISELFIGQQSQCNAVSSFEQLDRKNSPWQTAGWFGLIASVLILSFYSVVGGWVLDFEFRSLSMSFGSKSEEEIKSLLDALLANPLRQSIFHTLFMGLTTAIVMSGIKEGLEKWNKILMPALLVILVGLFGYSFSLPGMGDAFAFLFYPDFSKINAASVLESVGHSFFTLSLGMGCIITYGSYLSKKENLMKIAFIVALLDTAIALVAGLVIFSIVFSYDLDPTAGPGLMFVTLPSLFVKLPAGELLMTLFFLLVSFAALSSAVSIHEVSVTYVSEKYHWPHKKSAFITGLFIWLMGFLCLGSFNFLSNTKLFGLTFFDLFDKIASSLLLPLGGMLISLFYGWKLGKNAVEQTFKGRDQSVLQTGLLWSSRLLAPFAVFIVLLNIILKSLGYDLLNLL